jgi:putative transposase
VQKAPVFLPQLRDTEKTYSSKLWSFVKGNSDVFRYLVAEMYARGLSTRDIEATFTDEQGNCLISKSAVSEVTETLWEEYEAFTRRDLSGFEVAYIFLDAVFEPMRMFKSPKEGILCAWAILVSGEKVLLHMDLGNKESYQCWLEFLRSMLSRGLKVPVSVTTD